jgi:hypothetical protein
LVIIQAQPFTQHSAPYPLPYHRSLEIWFWLCKP